MLPPALSQSRFETQATIMFGHYPTSTIVSHQPGVRAVLGSGLVYLCGHLHNLHGLAGGPMVVRHKAGRPPGQHWCLLCVVSSSQMIVSHVNIDLGAATRRRMDYERLS